MPLLDMPGVLSKPIVESVYAVCNNCSRITVIISSIQLTVAIGGVAYAKLAGIGIGICMQCVCGWGGGGGGMSVHQWPHSKCERWNVVCRLKRSSFRLWAPIQADGRNSPIVQLGHWLQILVPAGGEASAVSYQVINADTSYVYEAQARPPGSSTRAPHHNVYTDKEKRLQFQ